MAPNVSSVINDKIRNGQLHDGMAIICMDRTSRHDDPIFRGKKIAIVGHRLEVDEVKIEIIAAVFRQRGETKGVTEVRNVERSFPPVSEFVPMFQCRTGHEIVHIDSYNSDVFIVFRKCPQCDGASVDSFLTKEHVNSDTWVVQRQRFHCTRLPYVECLIAASFPKKGFISFR